MKKESIEFIHNLSREGKRIAKLISLMNYNDLELLQLQVDTLFLQDEQNRLLRVNETDPVGPAPCFFLSRSLSGNIWRTRHDLPNDLAAELEDLAAGEPIVNDLKEQPYHLIKYTKLIERHVPVSSIEMGPSYYLPEQDPTPGTVRVTAENALLLQINFPYTFRNLRERMPVVIVVENGNAVAACYTARQTSLAAEVGVHTLEQYRGRGYATKMVRGWAKEIRAAGKIPFYSTSWDNIASQAVAMKLGAVLYGATLTIKSIPIYM